VQLSRKGLDDLGRTRDILTDGRGGPRPSESQAVETALDFFVDRKCPEKKAARAAERERKRKEREAAGGTKERSPTAPAPRTRPGASADGERDGAGERSRYIPAADRHAVIRRHGDRCFVEDCEVRHAGQLAHSRAFRFRGANKVWNLDRPCKAHHAAFDSGQLRLVEGPDGGVPLIVDRRGRVVGRVRRPGPP